MKDCQLEINETHELITELYESAGIPCRNADIIFGFLWGTRRWQGHCYQDDPEKQQRVKDVQKHLLQLGYRRLDFGERSRQTQEIGERWTLESQDYRAMFQNNPQLMIPALQEIVQKTKSVHDISQERKKCLLTYYYFIVSRILVFSPPWNS